MIKDYCILEKPDRKDLEQIVLQMIRQGWIPQGGLVVTALGDDRYLYAQAMVLVTNFK